MLHTFFFGLLFLVLESRIAYLLQEYGFDEGASWVDRFAAVL
jgi:hypothetical protein